VNYINGTKVMVYAVLLLILSLICAPGLTAQITDSNNTYTYGLNLSPTEKTDSYMLVIITPRTFARLLQPLVDHKNNIGISTILVTLDEVYEQISTGRDDAEKIKYFIKQAVEEWGITYVLLVGGMKHQRLSSWYLPVRYVAMDDGWEPHYISDLYYADIYNSEGNFSSWDSDGDGVYGEWYGDTADDQDIDLFPDVSVGRLPCRNKVEVRIMVKKIIEYETSAFGEPWFQDMVVIAGDTYLEHDNPAWAGYEGEYYGDLAIENMSGFNPIRLYASDGAFSSQGDVITAVSQGCGFLYFVGHGNPRTWGTHPPDNSSFITGLDVTSMRKLSNQEKFPVCVVSGCHNSQFDVSLWRIFNRWSRWVGEAAWECWGWRMTRKIDGGSIGTIGCTALGYTKEDKESFTGGLNELEVFFFKAYGQDDIEVLGETWATAITAYLDRYTPVDWNTPVLSDPWIDVKVVQSWVLMGDPSLQIGGYS
jgi:hypothetical protein